MDTGLDGSVAVVTGASRGIGLATATRLAAEGARVVLTSRKADALDAAVAHVVDAVPGAEVTRVVANAGDPDAAAVVVAAALDAFGAVDVVVNNAATNPYYGPALDISPSQWDKTFDVNLRGAHALIREAARAGMADRGGAGRRVYLSIERKDPVALASCVKTRFDRLTEYKERERTARAASTRSSFARWAALLPRPTRRQRPGPDAPANLQHVVEQP